MYVFSQQKYLDAWNFISDKYNLLHSECIKYFLNIYIIHYQRRFERFFINQILHFDIIITLKKEKTHAILKRNLMIFIDDLKTMIKNLHLLLINQRHNHVIKFENVKMSFSMKCRLDIFRNISAYVILNALRKISNKYK